jgi:hypothetical protein
MLSIGAGIAKLYIWITILFKCFLVIIDRLGFLKINSKLHKEIKNLKDL